MIRAKWLIEPTSAIPFNPYRYPYGTYNKKKEHQPMEGEKEDAMGNIPESTVSPKLQFERSLDTKETLKKYLPFEVDQKVPTLKEEL